MHNNIQESSFSICIFFSSSSRKYKTFKYTFSFVWLKTDANWHKIKIFVCYTCQCMCPLKYVSRKYLSDEPNARLEVIIATYYLFCVFFSAFIRRLDAPPKKKRPREIREKWVSFMISARFTDFISFNALDSLKTSALPSKCYQNLLAATDYDSTTFFFGTVSTVS